MNIIGVLISATLMASTAIMGAKISVSQAQASARTVLRAEGHTALDAAQLALDNNTILDGKWGSNEYCSLDIGPFDATSYSRPATATCGGLGHELMPDGTDNRVVVTRDLPCEDCSQAIAEEPTT